MARNSAAEVKRLLGVVRRWNPGNQSAKAGTLPRGCDQVIGNSSGRGSGGGGIWSLGGCRSVSLDPSVSRLSRCFGGSLAEGNRIVGYGRGLQSVSGELRSQLRRGVSSRLVSTAFSSSNGFGGKAVLNSGFKAGRLKGDVGGWRSYYVDNHGVEHFRRRGPVAWSETLKSPRSRAWIGAVVVVGGVVYVTHLETIPYTHRKHFVLVSPELERSVGERGFKMLIKEYKNKILPPNHPETLRVHRIASQIIQALMLGTRASNWGELDRAEDELAAIVTGDGWEAVITRRERPLLGAHAETVHIHDDSLDDAWIDKSRKKGLEKGEDGFKEHLNGMKWQVIVVDDDIMNAVCLPGGKIVVFTGLLKKFRTEPEIATVLAHEVGHAVARHSAESLTRNLFLVALQIAVLSVFYVPSLVNSISELLLNLPFSRRMEIEADHIGLILMAAAGYDPRLAPAFYEKLGSLEKVPEYAQFASTHPSGKKRGEKLRETATMEEAMAIYRRKIAGDGVDSFF